MKAPEPTGEPGPDVSMLAGLDPLADYLFALSDEHAAETAGGNSPCPEPGKGDA